MNSSTKANPLPITQVLPDIVFALKQRDELVLVAPPGAGKTTGVPLAILNNRITSKKILLLEPRRVAAQAVAAHMAHLLGETVGETVGLRMRQRTDVGRNTRLEVVTGGVLLRLMRHDPALEDYGVLVFDEFHERGLDSDTGLALALQGRALFRDAGDPLKIIVMSATLDTGQVAPYLGDAPVINSPGRAWPVAMHYGQSQLRTDLPRQAHTAIMQAAHHHSGNILVFLPGQGDINQLFSRLQSDAPSDTLVLRLHGSLDLTAQQSALAPLSADGIFRRKIVLATDIAETSLTIEGVTVVIDSGFRREPVFDGRTGLTRLNTVRISRASADQRAGRAGRTAAGHCYRLWSSDQPLIPFNKAEIEQADLAPLVLQLLSWGINQPDELAWLTPPPAPAWQAALNLLLALQAIEPARQGHRLTAHGNLLVNLPVHPRLAHMMIRGAQAGLNSQACRLAAALSEPGRPGDIVDLERVAEQFETLPSSQWMDRVRRQTRVYRELTAGIHPVAPMTMSGITGFLLACAYPDRIARQRAAGHCLYLLSNGRAARLPPDAPLCKHEWLVVADVSGATAQTDDRIYAAASLNARLFESALAPLLSSHTLAEWSDEKGRFVAEQQIRCGAIVLRRTQLTEVPASLRKQSLLSMLRQQGLGRLHWTEAEVQWRARVMCLRQYCITEKDLPDWPDLSDPALLQDLEAWLAPHLDAVGSLSDLRKLRPGPLLEALMPWPLPQKLNEWAPAAIVVPSGRTVTIDYRSDPPVLAVKLQEMFGCRATPSIGRGQIALLVHLLSPAGRPLQITRDLENFWRTGYTAVKKEMKGRYPRHPWPDDPLTAQPTRLTKRRSGTE